MALFVIFNAAIHLNNARRIANLFSSHPNLWVWRHGAYNMKSLWQFNRQTLFGVTLVRNKAVFLAEWLDFHFDQGFDFFFVYTHNASDIATQMVLEPYIAQNRVALIDAHRMFETVCSQSQPRIEHWFADCQVEVFNQALHVLRVSLTMYASDCWLAVFDVDEFIYGRSKCMHEVLRDIDESVDAVVLHGYTFGTSRYENNSQFQSVVQSHSLRSATVFTYKSISRVWRINTEFTGVHQPHCIIFFLCNHLLLYVGNPILAMNHYQFMSNEEQLKKIEDNSNPFYQDVYNNASTQASFNAVFDDGILHTPICR